MECIAERYDYDPSGEIMVLKRFCPVSTCDCLPVAQYNFVIL